MRFVVMAMALLGAGCAATPSGGEDQAPSRRADAGISSSCSVRGGACAVASAVLLRARVSDEARSIGLVELEVDEMSRDCVEIMELGDDRDEAPNVVRQELRVDCSRCRAGSYVRLRGTFADDLGNTSRMDCSFQTGTGF
jgi:hypothetical protein